jgi:hypothetical protein
MELLWWRWPSCRRRRKARCGCRLNVAVDELVCLKLDIVGMARGFRHRQHRCNASVRASGTSSGKMVIRL